MGSRSSVLIDAITQSWKRLGFSDAINDNAFFHLVLARLVEPTSKADSLRVLAELGIDPPHHNTFLNCLIRSNERDYREKIAEKCFAHSVATTGISLLLYDVTTLYFEAEKEDALRQVGYSKERRVDPQIVVGLLVDRTGFPLEIGCFEGAKAETHTIIPVIKAFQNRHGVADMVWGVTLLVDSRYQEGTTGNHVYESQDVHAGVQSRRGPVGGAGAPADRAGRA